MQAVILAGGQGTRLRPLTYKIPKALIPIKGKTLTEHVFDIYKKFGVTEVYLSISYLADQMEEHFKDKKKFGLNIKFLREDQARGTAGPLLLLREMGEEITEDFFMSNGDNLFDLDLKKMMAFHKSQGGMATIALKEVADVTSRGVVKMEGDKIVDFVEKPNAEEAPSKLISSGYYILSPKIFEFLPDDSFVMLENHVWPELARQGQLYGFKSEGQWFDTGTPERYAEVEKDWKGV